MRIHTVPDRMIGGPLKARRYPTPMKTPGSAAGSTARKSMALRSGRVGREVMKAARTATALVRRALSAPILRLVIN